MKDTPINTRYPADVLEQMKSLAEAHERSFNGEVIWALRKYIEKERGNSMAKQSREEIHEGYRRLGYKEVDLGIWVKTDPMFKEDENGKRWPDEINLTREIPGGKIYETYSLRGKTKVPGNVLRNGYYTLMTRDTMMDNSPSLFHLTEHVAPMGSVAQDGYERKSLEEFEAWIKGSNNG